MAALNDIKKRISSVGNTRKITKAMEVVSATKMRKSQERALKARGYAFTAFELLANLEQNKEVKKPALFMRPKGKKTLLIVITSDKGLAGSLNSNVLRKALAFLADQRRLLDDRADEAYSAKSATSQRESAACDVIVAGKKAHAFFKFRNVPVAKAFFGHGDFADFDEVKELTEFVKTAFLSGDYQRVVAIYTNFRSTLKQEAVIREVLPLKNQNLWEFIEGLAPEHGRYADERRGAADERRSDLRKSAVSANLCSSASSEYLFEPSPQTVYRELAERLFQMIIYHVILEANASEHSARMVAMKTASENAAEIVDDLTLLYNKGRQSKITQELVEITSGSDAVA